MVMIGSYDSALSPVVGQDKGVERAPLSRLEYI